jgi:tungstate transport system ATP-binding protein
VDADSARLIKSASLRARREWGTTLVVASHDLHWLYSVCDDTLYLHKGRVFAAGMVTVLEGEWLAGGKDQLTLLVGDNQSITATALSGVSGQTTAVVSADAIRATADKPEDNGSDNHLIGTVSRLLLEKRSSHIIATIDVGRTAFTLRFYPDQQDMTVMQPGQTVWLSFSADAVEWV